MLKKNRQVIFKLRIKMKPKIICITGPSGFGKGELVKLVLKTSDIFIRLKSYTDRPKYPEESDNDEYYFVDEETFTKMVENEEFIEWQRLYSNNYRYGKTKKEFEKIISENPDKVIITIINIINLPVFKRNYPHTKSIFVDVKDTQTLIENLKNKQNIITEDEFDRRYRFATEERRRRHLADFTMHMKDDLEDTFRDFLKLIDMCLKD